MNEMKKRLTLLIFLILAFTIPGDSQPFIPPQPTAWCNDYANVLETWQEDSLNALLGEFERRTSNQFFVAIFNRIPEGTYLEDFAVRLFEKWRPGLPDKNNGLLIVLFTEDRKARIEVGYGLEDVVPDALARRILMEQMVPFFKEGQYYRGLMAGLSPLMAAAEGKYQIPLDEEGGGGWNFEKILLWIIVIVTIIIAGIAVLISAFLESAGVTCSSEGTHKSPSPSEKHKKSAGIGGTRGSGGSGFRGGFGGLSGGGGASGSW